MSPSWYDILDVEPTASEELIRAAWKSAIADLDPTDRRFRVCNEAAEVLLDPRQRATYDAELAAETPPAVEPALTVELAKSPVEPAIHVPTSLEIQHISPTGARRSVPGWLLAGVALLTAAAVGVTAWLWYDRPSDETVESSTRAAQAAAETAIVPILSYDALHLDEAQAAAQTYMTTDYQKKYDQLFAVIRDNAPNTKTVVTAQVIDSGIVRSGEDRVDVLLFVDRPTTNKLEKTPVIYKDQVTVTMQKVGSDWLVDDLVTTPAGG